uniref:ADP-ribosylation factor n=1 Tax=Arcella intermedia TaxID=1963864 RepID=A0A6B2LKH5_9EUKA|eukprot:TRINITY_DN294_c2_g1_i1.p1 TRINITY_DN294_c2_g1~~TRINITY_DN294_c2_g1_i1.p1  ORF type:complete len:187 (-),score=32.31 TRINITY_DN294_c2_g1_i1:69-629(-)
MGNVLQVFGESFGGLTDDARILMLGLDGAGKSTILYKLKLGEVRHLTPTIGFNVESINYKNIKFTVWDIAGQARIRKLWHHYYENAKGLIFVLDSNDVPRISEAAKELSILMSEPELSEIPVLIFANKQDLPYAVDIRQLAEQLCLYDVLGRPWHIQSCCGVEGGGLLQGLDWLSGALKAQKARKT